ncbi:hypothetical protein H6F74_00540 [Trichocoleus sp. FACHB-90]|uniref:hypothetical protein n=1 Tax=Cyanophyceae TaxID=3028117 RepID=UPI001681EADC|nr:hypothetical protein [Trichocoleus sp. FACHB-90]MBD1924778.1 hypothetical protein [Trichocoleus sp. FACHB-90]
MTPQFKDLEALAQQEIELMPTLALALRSRQYQDAPLEEIFDLLESVTESFAAIAHTLPIQMQYSARKEIEFFVSLYLQRFHDALYQKKCYRAKAKVISR